MTVICTTDRAIALIGFSDERGLLCFPSDNKALPGIHFKMGPQYSLTEQLIEQLGTRFNAKISERELLVDPTFQAIFEVKNTSFTLYVGRCEAKAPEFGLVELLPSLLRGMPANKTRAVYLRAWQVLSGGM